MSTKEQPSCIKTKPQLSIASSTKKNNMDCITHQVSFQAKLYDNFVPGNYFDKASYVESKEYNKADSQILKNNGDISNNDMCKHDVFLENNEQTKNDSSLCKNSDNETMDMKIIASKFQSSTSISTTQNTDNVNASNSRKRKKKTLVAKSFDKSTTKSSTTSKVQLNLPSEIYNSSPPTNLHGKRSKKNLGQKILWKEKLIIFGNL